MSWFAKLKDALFLSPPPKKMVFLGMDCAGKTTFLYKAKSSRDEVVTTIPTIGFNVETLVLNRATITCWDVGGCDKIRPLWRHFTCGSSLLVFMVDSNDVYRMDEGKNELNLFLGEEEMINVPLLVFANKQDLPNACSIVALVEKLGLVSVRDRPWYVVPMIACSGDGVGIGLQCIHHILAGKHHLCASLPTVLSYSQFPADSPVTAAVPAEDRGVTARQSEAPEPMLPSEEEVAKQVAEHDQRRLAELRASWEARADSADDEFLAEVEAGTHAAWDHYVHLRIAWIHLSRHGLEEGSQSIERAIRSFLEKSGRTGTQKFHATMTHFWCVMMNHALGVLGKVDFKAFIAALFDDERVARYELFSGRSFGKWYSSQLMFSAEARQGVVEPDLQPFPKVTSYNHS